MAEPSRARKILIRTVTGASIVAVVAGIFAWAHYSASDLPVAIVGTVLAFASALEFGRMGSIARYRVGAALMLVALASFGLANDRTLWAERFPSLGGDGRGAVLFHVAMVAAGAAVMRVFYRATAAELTPRAILVAALGAAWVIAPLSLLAELWRQFGLEGTITFVALSKVGDITGYFVGNACGKHHPFPRLSPGKTTEGCLGSLVGGIVAGALFAQAGWISGGIGAGCLVGAVLNVAGQAGDLVESKVKRTTGVKDSSAWLGASGGFLDVLDSLFLTVPVTLILWPSGF